MINPSNLTPPKQALLVFGAGAAIMLGGILLHKGGILQMELLFPWTIATAFLLLFAMFNSIASLKTEGFAQYWGQSMYSYMALAVALGLLAWWGSGVPIGEAESYKFIYLVVTFGFLVFLTMVNTLKNIVNFAEKEDWTQPRRKR